MIYYTPEFMDFNPNIRGFVKHVLAITNEGIYFSIDMKDFNCSLIKASDKVEFL